MADDNNAEPGGELGAWFEFFNEIGILHQLSRAVFESRLSDGMTVAHFSVLNHLIRVRDGQTPLAMAKAFQIPKTSMTHTLTGLEARGFVSIRPNPEDGRSKRVWLTEEGRRFRRDAIALLNDDIATIAVQFDTGRILEVMPVLSAVRKILDSAR